MKLRFLATLFTSLALLAACGDSSEVTSESTSEGTEEVAEETETTTEAPPTTAETTTQAPPEESSSSEGDLEPGELDGMVIYEAKCARCHSSDGSGGRGPNLQGIAVEQPETTGGIEIVNNGGRGMPSFTESLTPEQIESVINYVWETF